MDSLSPPPTPGRKRSYYPDHVDPMPEFLSSNGSLFSSADDHHHDVEEEDEEMMIQIDIMTHRPISSLVLKPRRSSSPIGVENENPKTYRISKLKKVPPLPFTEPLPHPPTNKLTSRLFASLPRLPSLSEHNGNQVAPMEEEKIVVLKPEQQHIKQMKMAAAAATAAADKNKKLPPFKKTGSNIDHSKHNNMVARCA
jgi:hypothetical protein